MEPNSSGGVNLHAEGRARFSSSGVWELEALEDAASPDRELPLRTTATYPQTIACGLPFEGAGLFLTFLVNLPWEHWNPSSWSKVCVETVWDVAEDQNYLNVIQVSYKAINPQSQLTFPKNWLPNTLL